MINPLSDLLSSALADLAWTQAELVEQLALRGVVVTPSAVSHWLRGSGVAESKRPALADALGIPLDVLQSASLERARLSERA